MEKTIEKLDGKSKDTVSENIEKMKELFPDVFKEGKIDFEALQVNLGEFIEKSDERYNFSWNGKSTARLLAQTPSTGTLRPCPEESVNWDTTQNLFIEGDNLEVLKLLQKSYHKKVKMIYIDPPYNTGNDFIYPDNFRDNIKNYLDLTRQTDGEGKKFASNPETGGRYHTDWLNMIYPRLRLARNLLKEDGVIFISVDDNEIANILKVCNEVFGEENFITTITWQKKVSPSNDAKWFSSDHDHIVLFARSKEVWRPYRLPLNDRQRSYYNNPDNDIRGPWNSATYTCNKTRAERPNLYYPITNPNTKEEIYPDESAVWKYSKEQTQKHVDDGLLYWGKDGGSSKPRFKKFLSESSNVVPRSVWLYSDVGSTQSASKTIKDLFGTPVFDTPKPVELVKQMLTISSKEDDIVMDFFSGSCSTAHAVMVKNCEEGSTIRYIMVQLPEICAPKSAASKAGFSKITDIGKERIRKVMGFIKTKNSENAKDLGFKVFKLDSTNIMPWEADFESFDNKQLEASVDNIKTERSEADVVYEILLKYGLDLILPVEERTIEGKKVFIIGMGALIICLADGITLETVEGIAKLKDELKPELMRIVFKDNGFSDDNVKTNTIQTLKQYGIDDVKSI